MRRSLSQGYSSLHDYGSQISGSSRSYSSFGGLHDDSSTYRYGSRASGPQIQAIQENEVLESYPQEPWYVHSRQGLLIAGSSNMHKSSSSRHKNIDNVNRLYVIAGIVAGLLLGVILTHVSSIDSLGLVGRWVLLPGELFIAAMVCVLFPLILVNSVLGIMHFYAQSKASSLLIRMLLWSIFLVSLSAVVGVLLSFCLVKVFQKEENLAETTARPPPGSLPRELDPILFFVCPQSRAPLVVLPQGLMVCTNDTSMGGTAYFRMEDLSDSFFMASTITRNDESLSEKAILFVESLFPWSIFTAFLRGEVLSLIVCGVALGIALMNTTHFGWINASTSGNTQTDSSNFFFLAMMQVEIMMSSLLAWLLRILPFALVFIVSGQVLQAQQRRSILPEFLQPSVTQVATFASLLALGMALNIALMIAIVFIRLRRSPLPFLRHLIPTILVAFGSCSSIIALPSTVRSMAATREVSLPLAHFVCTTGTAINKAGTALYVAMACVYLLCASGEYPANPATLATSTWVTFPLVCAFCSLVVPPMPHGNIVVISAVLSELFDVPWNRSAVAFLAAIDFACDPFATVTNVLTSTLIALTLAHDLNEHHIKSDATQGNDSDEDQLDDLHEYEHQASTYDRGSAMSPNSLMDTDSPGGKGHPDG